MAHAIDHARGERRHRRQLKRDHDDARRSEQDDVEHDEESDSRIRESRVDVVFQPVVGRAAAVFLERLGIARLVDIELCSLEHDLLETEDHGTVRVTFLLAARMMLAMHGHPLLGWRARIYPKPKAKKVAQHGMKIDRPMRLVAMKPERNRHHRGVHPEERDEYVSPPAKIQKTVSMRVDEIHDDPSEAPRRGTI